MGATFWDRLIDFIKLTWLVIISVISPIRIAVWVLLVFFTVNFFVGYKSDVQINKRDFSLKKAFDGVKQLILYYALIFIVNMTLGLYEETNLAEGATKFMTWIVSYWYLVNILRNAREVFPGNETLKFLYDLLTVQVLEMLLARFGLRPQRRRNRINHDDENNNREEDN